MATIESNFTIPSLLRNIGDSKRIVEVSPSNRFLYYYTKKPIEVIQKKYPGWLPPQRSMTLSFEEYLRHIAENEELYRNNNNRHSHHKAHDDHDSNTNIDDDDNDIINNKISLKYLSLFFSKSEMDADTDNNNTTSTITSTSSSSSSSWVKHSLSILTPANKELFSGNATTATATTDYRYRGIVCRFSMRGTTGTAHFDSKRNFVAVIRGRRR